MNVEPQISTGFDPNRLRFALCQSDSTPAIGTTHVYQLVYSSDNTGAEKRTGNWVRTPDFFPFSKRLEPGANPTGQRILSLRVGEVGHISLSSP